jgi:hypothetical protein
MGGATSTVHDLKTGAKDAHGPAATGSSRTDEEIVNLMMPLYFTREPITPDELSAAVAAWKLITNDRSEHFNVIKKNSPIQPYPHANCMELFYETFYMRLFDVHPIGKTLFHRSINKQGTFFMRFVSMAIDEINDPPKWDKTFKNLTDIHNKMGVKAMECKEKLAA